MKIHKPAQAFLGAEGKGPIKSFRAGGARSRHARAEGNPKPYTLGLGPVAVVLFARASKREAAEPYEELLSGGFGSGLLL